MGYIYIYIYIYCLSPEISVQFVKYCIAFLLLFSAEQIVFRLTGGRKPGEGFLQVYSRDKFVYVSTVVQPEVICASLFVE